jgi:hypothetical protein
MKTAHALFWMTIVATLLLIAAAPCQASLVWLKAFNGSYGSTDYGYDIVTDAAGNAYVTGYSYTNNSGTVSYDCATIKYDKNGNQMWASLFNGSGNSTDYGQAVALDPAGNVYVTGYSYTTNSGVNSYDYCTIKYNNAGVQQWVKTYNGSGLSTDYAYDIQVDSSGNAYVTGMSYTNNSGTLSYDYCTVKYDTNGNQQWVALYNGTGASTDYGRAVAVDSSGNVYVTGYTYTNNSGTTTYDIGTVKYNSAGAQQWAKTYNGPSGSSDYGYDLKVDTSGNVYATGYAYATNSGSSTPDMCLVKYDTNGNQQWVKLYNGSSNSSDYGYAVVLDSAGNAYLGGYTYQTNSGVSSADYGVVKFDAAGNQQWVGLYNGPGNSSDVVYNGNPLGLSPARGSVFLFGYSYGSGTAYADYCLIAWDAATGTFKSEDRWNNSTTSQYDYGRALSVYDADKSVYVTGYAYQTNSSVLSYDIVTIKFGEGGNKPPIANAGGPYTVDCNGNGGKSTINLDGSKSSDPDNDPLTFSWTTTCGGGMFDNSKIAKPKLSLNSPPPCPINCNVTLTVDDGKGGTANQTTTVTLRDVNAPVLSGVPSNAVVECDKVPPPAPVTATDVCAGSVPVTMQETRKDGNCTDNYTLTRTWTAKDNCSNSQSASQTITVRDTTPPLLAGDFEPVMNDEFPDEQIDGLWRVRYTGADNCDTAPKILGFLNVYGNDETCDDEDQDFIGYPVKDGDVVQRICQLRADCWASDEAPDPLYPLDPVIKIKGPAWQLTVKGQDRCANPSEEPYIDRCLDPDDCITAITLKNSIGLQQTFWWYEFSQRKETTFTVGGESAEIRVNCHECLTVGDRFDTLEITCIQAGKKLAHKCKVPVDTFTKPCL